MGCHWTWTGKEFLILTMLLGFHLPPPLPPPNWYVNKVFLNGKWGKKRRQRKCYEACWSAATDPTATGLEYCVLWICREVAVSWADLWTANLLSSVHCTFSGPSDPLHKPSPVSKVEAISQVWELTAYFPDGKIVERENTWQISTLIFCLW